jgi:hypothetical protein
VTDDTSPAMARYARGAALRRMSKTALLKLCASGVTTPDGRTVALETANGPLDRHSKAGIIDLILMTEFGVPEAKAA